MVNLKIVNHDPLLTVAGATNVSDKYRFVSTQNAVEQLQKLTGCVVDRVISQSRGNRAYGKHVVLFNLAPIFTDLEGITPQLALVNSHNGSCAFRLIVALRIHACSNGIFTTHGKLSDVRVTHRGNVGENLAQAYAQIISQLPRTFEAIKRMQGINLSIAAQYDFAKAAVGLRQDADNGVNYTTALQLGRELPSQKAPTLWNVFNRLQNSLLQGGYTFVTAPTAGTGKGYFTTARRLTSVTSIVNVNQALWELATKFAA